MTSISKVFYFITFMASLPAFGQASADSSTREAGAFISQGVSSYRDAFGDIKQTHRGSSASVSMAEGTRGSSASLSATVDELLSLYESSKFDAALERIRDLNSQLRNSNAPQKQNLATSLDFKGVILQRKGDFLLAIQAHGEALSLLEELGIANTSQGLAVRNNLAVAHYFLGDYDASEKALSDILTNSSTKPIARARARNNRGLIYTDLGLPDKAMIDFSHAESDARTADAHQLLAEILNNKARGLVKAQNRPEAERAFAGALENSAKAKDLALTANILDSWAEMLVDNSEFQTALDKLAAAAEAETRANAPLVKITILKNRGRALAGLGKTEEALQAYSEALDLAEPMGLRSQARDILAYRGRLQASLNNTSLAIEDYTSAIELTEKTRERLSGESETGFIQETARLYKEMVVLLLKRKGPGDTEIAFSMLERSQSAVLQEQMSADTPELRDKQAMQDISGARGVLRQEASLAKKLQNALSASNPNQKEIDALRLQLAKARREAVQALGELSDKYKGRYDHFVPAAVDPKYLRDIADRLPPKSLLVTYAFGDDGLYIFLASKDGKIEFRQNLNVSRASLEKMISEYRTQVIKIPGKSREDWRVDSWSDPKWIPLRDATVQLYQQLLAPIADRFQGIEQIIFAPTGQLYYLPFHALGNVDSTGRKIQYLALSQKVSYVAPGSLLKAFDADHGIKSGGKQKPRILALGDVQFGPTLELLPASKDELKAIKDIFGPEAVLLEGQKATKRGLLDALNATTATQGQRRPPASAAADGFRFVLLSTHGILNAREPRSSYLALEDGKKLTAQEIANLDLRGVSVVTLSACETGLAGNNPGADLMSLGEYVSLAGASSVLASLWKVDDFQTAHLMREFFTNLKKDSNNKSAALQRAQVALATHPESTHPFFWSPFVLYGKAW